MTAKSLKARRVPTGRAKAAVAKLGKISHELLERRVIERRAFEAVVWGMPAVNFVLMTDAAREAGAAWNQIVYWSRLPSWKNQTLTPNPDIIYLMPFIDLSGGPMVLEIPPAEDGSITGSIDDAWQSALEDVGPAGVDKGKGGKYLLLPPGYKEKPPEGFIALPCATLHAYALLRSNLASGSDAEVAKAVAYGKRVALYPLAPANAPAPTKFVDVADMLFDATIPYDARFFDALDRFVRAEPWLTRDKAMIDTLTSIGIAKAKAFAPAATARAILKTAAEEAHAWLDHRYERLFEAVYFDGRHWAFPVERGVVAGMQNNFADADRYPLDGRATLYSMAFFSAKHLGEGQFYLVTLKDRDGRALDGGKAYRLNVPPNVPVSLYWSAVVYDRATHALIRNTTHSSRSSNTQGLRANSDGSVNIHFGPKPPKGMETNWIPTRRGGGFEVMFRFYGPKPQLFDKTWILSDIERGK
jgi:hypothetical protein